MQISVGDFTGSIIGIVVALLMVVVLGYGIIGGLVGTEAEVTAGTAYIKSGTIEATLVTIIPLILLISVILMVVYKFIGKGE